MTAARRLLCFGIAASPGVAFGHVHLVDRRKLQYPKHHIGDGQVAGELARLDDAIASARASLLALKERATDHSAILDAHLLMMEDPILLETTKRQITVEKRCAEWALKTAVAEIRKSFDALGDAYFRERRSDIDFVGDRILSAMVHGDSGSVFVANVPEDAIVVAHDLSPADTIALSKRRVRAFVTEVGGATSHTAILARALDIPAVIGCAGILEKAGMGDTVIVDGSLGEVVLEPTDELVARYKNIARSRAQVYEGLVKESERESVTADGSHVTLLANIEIPDEIAPALRAGAEGVGLYRSEFLYINRADLPTEHDHEAVCASILDALGDKPAALRTFDIGSDKLAAAIRLPREHNPALGLRACRLGLARPSMLRAQLRGMIRAVSARKRGSIMLPMIGSVDELESVREMITEEQAELEKIGVAVWRDMRVGVMIELPAAVLIADELAARCDYFSVGTNDLIQYMLAIDRGNEQVAHMYQPLHPGVLRALRTVVDAGHRHHIPVSLCGELAADPTLSPITVGLGFDALSMPAMAIPRVRYVVRRLSSRACRDMVDAAVRLGRAREVEALVHAMFEAAVPDGRTLLRDAAHG